MVRERGGTVTEVKVSGMMRNGDSWSDDRIVEKNKGKKTAVSPRRP